MLDIPSISAVVAAVGVLVGVAFAYLEVRNLVRQRETDVETRQAQLFMQIYEHFYDKEFLSAETEVGSQWKWKDYDDFMRKYGLETNLEAFAKWDCIGTYYKGLGVLVKRKLIDVNLVKDLMADYILRYWDRFGSIIEEFRIRHPTDPHAFEWVEYLYNEMKKKPRLQQAQQQTNH